MTGKEIFVLQERVALFDDQHAFRQLFRHYYTPLFQFAVAIVKVREPAEEIVGDLFVMIWDKRSTITDIVNFKVYLYIAVKNRCLNYINRKSNTQPLDPDQVDIKCSELIPDPEELVLASELLQQANKAIQALPPKCRIIYKLVKEDGLTYKEVAEVLAISPRTVEHQIATAVRKIAVALNIDFSSYRKPSSFSRRS
ncbi:MAG: RNA polymerase sigma-70 factor [Agriterribacter sp.]